MKNLKVKKLDYLICCLLTLLWINKIFIQAQTDYIEEKKQFIFVLDGSQSMSQDRWQEAVDGVALITAMLPDDYEIAVLAYNQDVMMHTEFCQPIEEQLKLLREVETSGYTNTGLAVHTALKKFELNGVTEKRIVIISDGEISMRKEQDTKDAIALYDEAIEHAQQQNVAIDILLFESDDVEEQIQQGAKVTGGYIYQKTDGVATAEFLEKYIFGQLGIERIVVGTYDAPASENIFSLQDTLVEKAWILMTAESVI